MGSRHCPLLHVHEKKPICRFRCMTLHFQKCADAPKPTPSAVEMLLLESYWKVRMQQQMTTEQRIPAQPSATPIH
ncbi:Hypothetical predicted protein [Podarcis lilfordi]|uniref:Uncharacterized protein n=1 Tax=Podarcis lilfordi TaxID=74358 RepID=A0AA35LH38_9SAUR|nr:Hypothetical predicted protein [Podarcis lilfordi]